MQKTFHVNAIARGLRAIRVDADPVALVQQIKAGFEAFRVAQAETDKRIEDLIKAQAGTALTEAKAAIAAAEASAREVTSLAARLLEAEQKLVAGVQNQKQAPKSLGIFIVESDAYKHFISGGTNKVRIEANTVLGQDGSGNNTDTLTAPQRLPGIIPGAFRALRIRDVLPSGTTSSNMIEYTRELAFTNDAAETAEGATKPESDITFELATSPVRTVAHWLKLSRQVMDDAPALASYIDGRLRYGVEARIDAQLLNGNGVGQNISGLTDAGNFVAFTPTVGETPLDNLNRSKYEIINSDYPAEAVILNPADWGAIERLKTTFGEYVIGNPLGLVVPVLWGLPVVVTNQMTAGNFWMGAPSISHQVWNRQGTVVEMTESNDTDFVKNLITVRAEARLALATYRPASTRYGALEDAGP